MTFHPGLIHQLVFDRADIDPESPALLWQGQSISYSALRSQIESIAARLATVGVVGDRIGVLAWNRPEYVALLYAVPAAGRVLVPLNARLARRELREQIGRTGLVMLFADASLLAALDIQGGDSVAMPTIEFGDAYRQWLAAGSGAELPKLVSTDDAWLLFTSGTTGQPKGAVLTHRSLCAGLESAASGRPVQAGDRYLYPFPLFHVSAHNVLLQHKFGAAVVLLTGFDASKVLHSIQEFGVTTLSLAPTMLAMLFDHPDFNPRVFDGVRTIGYGASAMPEGLLRKFMSQCDTGLSGGYGMTELSGSVAFLGPEEHRLVLTSRSELLGSVGKPTVGVDLRLLDEAGSEVPPGATGEIVVRGPQVMDRYWDDPEATMVTVVEGWLHTGDIGRFDEAGNLYIVDRKKDLIITGGENVSSREVEEVLVRHPQVSQAAVVGLEDPRWGEAVWAAVVVSPGSEMIGEELLEYCRSQLAGYKTPKQLQIVKELPVNASGKIDKRQVRELLRLGTYAVFPAAP